MSEGEDQRRNKHENKSAEEDRGSAIRDDLPWSRDLDSSTRELYKNTSDNKNDKQFRLLLAEYICIRHIHGNLQGKTGPQVGPGI